MGWRNTFTIRSQNRPILHHHQAVDVRYSLHLISCQNATMRPTQTSGAGYVTLNIGQKMFGSFHFIGVIRLGIGSYVPSRSVPVLVGRCKHGKSEFK